ncbi:MAG: phosphatidylglycerophosphatase A [Candidatus Neomarinimicrobiota bacterium]|nr:phosphatidylglycerophosphatase A [Candidatus Neomarinimicrobiota bacterium]MEE3195670.1 phosphatidylglycerophosphatase A [Candidatus Neomarinimicrobiota bacterium]
MRLKISEWIATCFKVGYLPLAPGTWGSVFAILLWWVLLKDLNTYIFGVVIIIFLLIGIVVSNIIIDQSGDHDPSHIIIDELVGQWLALFLLPEGFFNIAISFILFRFFDIIKPWPIRLIEKLPKGLGVMSDDLTAGLITLVLIQVINIYLF